jgi:hypothetical protein
MGICFAESDLPVFERWMNILENFPALRGKRLYADMTAELADVYRNGAGAVLHAAIDMLHLRCRFFEILNDNKIGRTHQNDYEIEAARVWQQKLLDRLVDVDVPHFRNGQLIPSEAAKMTRHMWLH